jgi:hypothetical protein
MDNEFLGDDGKPWDGESAVNNPKPIRSNGEAWVPMTGRVARMHNITYVPMSEDDIINHENENFKGVRRPSGGIDYPDQKEQLLDRNVPLFTKQAHFSAEGIRHYVDTPDELFVKDTDYPTPVVYTAKDGRTWIHDGHHRIITSRLRGEQSIKVINRGVGA